MKKKILDREMKKKDSNDFFRLQREQLVQYLISSQAVKSESIRKAFLNVKRELFMPEGARQSAYSDSAMPIGSGQTISQPSTIAAMLELLDVKPENKILEVGSGSAYVLALLSELAGKKGKVFGIELLQELKEKAEKNLKAQGNKNITLKVGDGTAGWKENAPFDRILVSAACPFVPKPLAEQLAENGILVAPVGDRFTQVMNIVKKINGKTIKEEYMGGYFAFVPLRGEYGWDGAKGFRG